MHLSPALVSLPIFALPLMAAPIPSPRPDALTGNGGNAFTGAAGDASGGDNCGNSGDLLGLGLFNGNTNNGGEANSGNAYAGNGGNFNGVFGFDPDHNSNRPNPTPDEAVGNKPAPAQANNNPAPAPADNHPYPAPGSNGPIPNEQAADQSYPDAPKTYIGKPKGKPKNGSKPKKPKVNAVHTRPQPDTEGDYQQPSNIAYVAGNGGDAYSGAGGQATGGSSNASSGTQNINSGYFDNGNDFIDVDALNNSLNDASALNGVLGHDNDFSRTNSAGSDNRANSAASANSGPAVGGDGGSIQVVN